MVTFSGYLNGCIELSWQQLSLVMVMAGAEGWAGAEEDVVGCFQGLLQCSCVSSEELRIYLYSQEEEQS